MDVHHNPLYPIPIFNLSRSPIPIPYLKPSHPANVPEVDYLAAGNASPSLDAPVAAQPVGYTA